METRLTKAELALEGLKTDLSHIKETINGINNKLDLFLEIRIRNAAQEEQIKTIYKNVASMDNEFDSFGKRVEKIESLMHYYIGAGCALAGLGGIVLGAVIKTFWS